MISIHSLLVLLLLAVCFSIDDVSAVDTAASESQQSRRQSKLRQLQFLPGDLCRCEADWEDFYSELSQQQQPQVRAKRQKYPGLMDPNSDVGDRRHRGLQHYDYDTQEENENGLVVVEDIFVLPPIDPFCISLGARNRRRDLGVAAVDVPAPAPAASETVTTTTRSGAYNRGNGRLEILIGGAPGAVHQQEEEKDEPNQNEKAGEERDLVNCHGAHLEAAAYARRNPYNRRPANNVYQRPGTYWANRPYTTANNAGAYGTKIMGIGKGRF